MSFSPIVREYLFDVKLFAAIRVMATSQAQARSLLARHVDGAEANLGSWPDGSPILTEVYQDDADNDELVEIDGVVV